MLQISQMCWQNLAGVFRGLWASTHALSDEPSRAWQSSVLLAQLEPGCSLCPPSAPAFPDSLPWPAALFLCIQHAARPSSLLTGAALLPSAICHSLFCPIPALPTCAFLLTPSCIPGIPVGWDRITKEGHSVLGALKETSSSCKGCGNQWEMVGV